MLRKTGTCLLSSFENIRKWYFVWNILKSWFSNLTYNMVFSVILNSFWKQILEMWEGGLLNTVIQLTNTEMTANNSLTLNLFLSASICITSHSRSRLLLCYFPEEYRQEETVIFYCSQIGCSSFIPILTWSFLKKHTHKVLPLTDFFTYSNTTGGNQLEKKKRCEIRSIGQGKFSLPDASLH